MEKLIKRGKIMRILRNTFFCIYFMTTVSGLAADNNPLDWNKYYNERNDSYVERLNVIQHFREPRDVNEDRPVDFREFIEAIIPAMRMRENIQNQMSERMEQANYLAYRYPSFSDYVARYPGIEEVLLDNLKIICQRYVIIPTDDQDVNVYLKDRGYKAQSENKLKVLKNELTKLFYSLNVFTYAPRDIVSQLKAHGSCPLIMTWNNERHHDVYPFLNSFPTNQHYVTLVRPNDDENNNKFDKDIKNTALISDDDEESDDPEENYKTIIDPVNNKKLKQIPRVESARQLPITNAKRPSPKTTVKTTTKPPKIDSEETTSNVEVTTRNIRPKILKIVNPTPKRPAENISAIDYLKRLGNRDRSGALKFPSVMRVVSSVMKPKHNASLDSLYDTKTRTVPKFFLPKNETQTLTTEETVVITPKVKANNKKSNSSRSNTENRRNRSDDIEDLERGESRIIPVKIKADQITDAEEGRDLKDAEIDSRIQVDSDSKIPNPRLISVKYLNKKKNYYSKTNNNPDESKIESRAGDDDIVQPIPISLKDMPEARTYLGRAIDIDSSTVDNNNGKSGENQTNTNKKKPGRIHPALAKRKPLNNSQKIFDAIKNNQAEKAKVSNESSAISGNRPSNRNVTDRIKSQISQKLLNNKSPVTENVQVTGANRRDHSSIRFPPKLSLDRTNPLNLLNSRNSSNQGSGEAVENSSENPSVTRTNLYAPRKKGNSSIANAIKAKIQQNNHNAGTTKTDENENIQETTPVDPAPVSVEAVANSSNATPESKDNTTAVKVKDNTSNATTSSFDPIPISMDDIPNSRSILANRTHSKRPHLPHKLSNKAKVENKGNKTEISHPANKTETHGDKEVSAEQTPKNNTDRPKFRKPFVPHRRNTTKEPITSREGGIELENSENKYKKISREPVPIPIDDIPMIRAMMVNHTKAKKHNTPWKKTNSSAKAESDKHIPSPKAINKVNNETVKSDESQNERVKRENVLSEVRPIAFEKGGIYEIVQSEKSLNNSREKRKSGLKEDVLSGIRPIAFEKGGIYEIDKSEKSSNITKVKRQIDLKQDVPSISKPIVVEKGDFYEIVKPETSSNIKRTDSEQGKN